MASIIILASMPVLLSIIFLFRYCSTTLRKFIMIAIVALITLLQAWIVHVWMTGGFN